MRGGGVCNKTRGLHSLALSVTRTPSIHTHGHPYTHAFMCRFAWHSHTLFPQPSRAGPRPLSWLLPCGPHSSPLFCPEVGTSYYAVAVVKRSSNLTIHTLKGVKSCHTGINRTVGWNVPVGYLVESGSLSVMGCDVLKGEGSHGRRCSWASGLRSPRLLPAGPLAGQPPSRLAFISQLL